MHIANRVELTDRECEELYLLVDSFKRNENAVALANARIKQDESLETVYYGLRDAGHISAHFYDNTITIFKLLQPGIDWVDAHRKDIAEHEYELTALEAKEDAKKKAQWRHDLRMTLIGAVVGGILGFAGGVFGAWISFSQGWF